MSYRKERDKRREDGLMIAKISISFVTLVLKESSGIPVMMIRYPEYITLIRKKRERSGVKWIQMPHCK